jgi:serine/threonine protein kinase
MAYLERNSVEYRMISPEDIFLTDEGVVKVIDPELSNASKCINARPYYAPELLTSHR